MKGLAVAGLLLTGCATATPEPGVMFASVGDTLYVFTPSREAARRVCVALGGDPTPTEARPLATDPERRVIGCSTQRHVIVCMDKDEVCRAHEERHRREGAFHAILGGQ